MDIFDIIQVLFCFNFARQLIRIGSKDLVFCCLFTEIRGLVSPPPPPPLYLFIYLFFFGGGGLIHPCLNAQAEHFQVLHCLRFPTNWSISTSAWEVHVYMYVCIGWQAAIDSKLSANCQQLDYKGPQSTESLQGIIRRIYIANFAIFKFAVFCLTIYTCQKNPELSASTKLRDFLDRYCACPTISYFFLRSGVLTTACVCVCVCVMYVCACLCVCSRMCVCLTQMSSFSNFDIIVLDWGAYKCVCVCVSNTSVIAYWVKYNSPRLGVPAVACVSNTNVLV